MKLIELRTMTKIASFRLGVLRKFIARKMPIGERKRKIKKLKLTGILKKVAKKDGN